MADPRFYTNQGPLSLEQISSISGAALPEHADVKRRFADVAPLDRAGEEHLSFLDNNKYLEMFTASRAGACFVRAKYVPLAPKGMLTLVHEDPYRCYALITQKFYPYQIPKPYISERSFISESAVLGDGCIVEPGAVIGDGVKIGARCFVGANAVIMSHVKIGDDCIVGACTTLSHCLIGSRVILHRGVHIGQDGFGFAMGHKGHVKVPQLGRVIIEDDVEIGSNSCIDRGAGPDTLIGQGTKIDNLVQIGHNVQIGKHAVIVSQVGIAGSSHIGDGAVLAGQVGIAGHVKIGAGVRLAAQSGVMHDIPTGAAYGGSPAVPVKDWQRQILALAKLVKRKGENT